MLSSPSPPKKRAQKQMHRIPRLGSLNRVSISALPPPRILFTLHRSPGNTPLGSFYKSGHWKTLSSTHLTATVRLADTATPDCGLTPSDVSVQILCKSIAMALLLAGIDSNIMKLIRRWCSNKIIRYLHVTTQSLSYNHAKVMHQNGDFHLIASSLTT